MSTITDFFQTLFPYVLSIGGVMLLFGGTVMIHELGHFLAAKKFGLRIDAFSIGMGPALWQRKINGVMYKISLLPIGGYVALPQMDITGSAFENEDAKDGKLTEIAPWKRIVIALAGPVMNVLAAIVLCTIVWQVGKQPDEGFQNPVVGEIHEKGSPYLAGLRPGDRIRMVNDDKVHFWADVQISAMLNNSLDMQIVRDGEILYLADVPTTSYNFGKRTFRTLEGVIPEMPEILGVEIMNFTEGSPAYSAGLKPGDRLLTVNDVKVEGTDTLRELVNVEKPGTLEITYQRGRKISSLPVTPIRDELDQRWVIGIMMDPVYETVHPLPLRQIQYFRGQIFRTLVAFTRTSERGSAAKNIGGPVMILSGMHMRVKESVIEGLWFTALININLAIINLLPLIILDGGHIMVALFEWITGRRPYRRLIVGMANVMVVILITLMVFLVFNDSMFLKELNSDSKPEPSPTSAPTSAPAVQDTAAGDAEAEETAVPEPAAP